MEHISWIGVLVGALTLFVLGGIWYTVLFGKAYREVLGVPEPVEGAPPQGPGISTFVGQFVAGLAMSAVLAWLIGESSAGRGALVGLAGGLLVAAALGQFYLFEGKTLKHYFINAAYIVLGLTGVGAILGAFQG